MTGLTDMEGKKERLGQKGRWSSEVKQRGEQVRTNPPSLACNKHHPRTTHLSTRLTRHELIKTSKRCKHTLNCISRARHPTDELLLASLGQAVDLDTLSTSASLTLPASSHSLTRPPI